MAKNIDFSPEVTNRSSKEETEWLSWIHHSEAPRLQFGEKDRRQRRFQFPDPPRAVYYVDGYDPSVSPIF